MFIRKEEYKRLKFDAEWWEKMTKEYIAENSKLNDRICQLQETVKHLRGEVKELTSIKFTATFHIGGVRKTQRYLIDNYDKNYGMVKYAIDGFLSENKMFTEDDIDLVTVVKGWK